MDISRLHTNRLLQMHATSSSKKRTSWWVFSTLYKYTFWSHSRLSMGEDRILTTIPISLRLSRRQLLYHCAIHARPHLMAKAFRYLRLIFITIINLIVITGPYH